MEKLDPITVSALKVLSLDTDRVPRNHSDLVFAVRSRLRSMSLTREQTDAYRYLWGCIGQLDTASSGLDALAKLPLARRLVVVDQSAQNWRELAVSAPADAELLLVEQQEAA